MNLHSKKLSASTMMKMAILAIIVSSFSLTGFAQSKSTPDTTAREISVKYLGADEDMMLIAVKYNNVTSSKFVLSIYNSDGEVVFRDAYSAKDFEKKFKIPKENGKVNFVFSGVNDKLSRSYVIHNTSRTIEDVVVTKVY